MSLTRRSVRRQTVRRLWRRKGGMKLRFARWWPLDEWTTEHDREFQRGLTVEVRRVNK